MMGASIRFVSILLLILLESQLSFGTSMHDKQHDYSPYQAMIDTGPMPLKGQPRGWFYQMGKDFAHYHLYFNGHLSPEQCYISDLKNHTHTILSKKIDMCADPSYQPRVLFKNQISWKPRVDPNKSHQSLNKTNSSSSNGNTVSNGTGVDNNSTEVSDKNKEIIHDFLLFALLLPDHPFSEEVSDILSSVAPMYPHVTTVIGNAYEFPDICSKYLVHSFPKLLYFKAGIFSGFNEERLSASSLSGSIAKWTHSLPRTLPLSLGVKQSPDGRLATVPTETYVESWLPISSGSIQYINAFNFSLFKGVYHHLQIPVPRANMEPFLGSVEAYNNWNNFAFISAGVYAIVRLVLNLKSFVG